MATVTFSVVSPVIGIRINMTTDAMDKSWVTGPALVLFAFGKIYLSSFGRLGFSLAAKQVNKSLVMQFNNPILYGRRYVREFRQIAPKAVVPVDVDIVGGSFHRDYYIVDPAPVGVGGTAVIPNDGSAAVSYFPMHPCERVPKLSKTR